jgi:hypothetical protein
LKEYLDSKDIEVNVDGYKNLMRQQTDSLGRDTTQNMEKRSLSLGMRSSTS